MVQYNDNISYEIVEDGYKIYYDGKLWITQLGEYSKPIDRTKSFEENCIAQLDELTTLAPAEEMTNEDLALAIEELAAIVGGGEA